MSRVISLLLLLLPCTTEANEVVVYQFTASWCVPCQQMRPTIASLGQEGKRFVVVDIDANPQLTSRFKVNKVPTFIRVSNGLEVKRLVGMQSANSLRTLFNPTKRDGPSPVVIVRSKSGTSGIRGTGCHIGRGYILTCEHVLRRNWRNVIETSDGKSWEAKVIASDAALDLSILKVTNEFPVPFVKLTQNTPAVGSKVKMYGMSGSFRAWDGEVIGYRNRYMRAQTKGTRMGDSGGPILLGENIVCVIVQAEAGWTITSGPNAAEIIRFIQSAGLQLYERE